MIYLFSSDYRRNADIEKNW